MKTKLVLLSLLTSLSMGLFACTNSGKKSDSVIDDQPDGYVDVLPENNDGNIFQAFNWKFSDIKDNLSAIRNSGFKVVQTSPVQQPKNGGPNWYSFYQPVSFAIATDSPLGTKQELKDLCDEAEKYGIAIICDIVFNHMANIADGELEADGTPIVSPEVKRFEPDIYAARNDANDPTFHHNKSAQGSGAITQYYAFGDLPDLNTGNTLVQSRCLALLKECIDVGVDGFRFDAAKHIETPDDPQYASNFWPNVLGEAKTYYKNNTNKDLIAYGEVLNDVDGGRSIDYYTKYMKVSDNSYIAKIASASVSGKADLALEATYGKNTNPSNILTWVESHDTYVEAKSHISNRKASRQYAIISSRKDSVAMFLARPSETFEVGVCADYFFENEEVGVANRFHNRFIGYEEALSAKDSVFITERYNDQNGGALLVNLKGKGETELSLSHLKDGTYYNQLNAEKAVVSGGKVNVTFDETGIIVLTKSKHELMPTITISERNVSFADSLSIQVSVLNQTEAYYTINGGEHVFLNGQQNIVLGKEVDDENMVHLDIFVSNSEFSIERHLHYRKVTIIEGYLNIVNLKPSYLTDYKLYYWAWGGGSNGIWLSDYTVQNGIVLIDFSNKSYTGFLLAIFEADYTITDINTWDKNLVKQTGNIDTKAKFYDATNFQIIKERLMNKKFYVLLCAAMMSLSILGCKSKGNNGSSSIIDEEYGEDEVGEELVLPTNVTRYTLDETDYDSLQEAPTDLIRIFYHRNDNTNDFENYRSWRIWAWDMGGGNGWWYEFTKYNAYGVICEIPVSAVAANGTSISKLGFVITTCSSTTATWSGTYSKDPDCDLSANIKPTNPGGIQRVYAKTNTESVFYSQESAFMSSLDYARYLDMSTIRAIFVTTHEDFKIYRPRFEITKNGNKVTNFTLGDFSISKSGGGYQAAANLTFTEPFAYTDTVVVKYTIAASYICTSDVLMTAIYDSEEFVNANNYNGDDLGVTFDSETNPTKTFFKVWAPTSASMKLNIYASGDYRVDAEPEHTYDMTLGQKGVWEYAANEDLDGKYYTYTVTNSAGTNEVVDPYARSAGLNGKRGMVLNFTRLNETITGWNSDQRYNFGEPTDASIYEIHVRDMTINPNSGVEEQYRGKYLGLAQSGTRYRGADGEVTTGLDHLAELGITHVQIQPTYDYSSVNEENVPAQMSETNYNWGYDPQNYNCLEGSYSTNPSDGTSRVREFKQMIMALHQKGINAIMDVVYNHTSSFSDSNFEKLVPYYYHRTKASGTAYNGSGCGNEMASERYMVNKFVRESCKFYTQEYHLSGFRFDLMGLMDNQVMIDVYKDCAAIDSKTLIFGEPWTGGSTKLKTSTNADALTNQQTIQGSLAQPYFVGDGAYVGAFSDGFRNGARGDNGPGKGFVQGIKANASSLVPGFLGLFNNNQTTVEPQQVINYVSCHDNYTLYDQLVQTVSAANLEKAYKQAEALVFTAQGIPFMQEGEDFMRTKAYEEDGQTKYCHNSYNVGDLINNMDYALKLENKDMFDYFKLLINKRVANRALRLSSRAEINSHVTVSSSMANNGVVRMDVNNVDGDYIVLHSQSAAGIDLIGEYRVIFSSTNNFYDGDELSGSVTLAAYDSLILKKVGA